MEGNRMTHKGWLGGIMPVACDEDGDNLRYSNYPWNVFLFGVLKGFANLYANYIERGDVKIKVRWMRELTKEELEEWN